ncbi:MAG: leucine-rich repeat domain-containing protein [Paludibacteraceae bacterium]|nr:leucine-rich repeat domain-containing protein [Paludibacteraceae bacterium]
MKTKIFTLFVVLMATTALWAYDFQSGDLYYNITSSSAPYTVEVTYKSMRSNYSNTSLTIPSSVQHDGITYAVTGIDAKAFYNCKSLIEVKIPTSVTTIEGAAFLNSALYKDQNNWENEVLYVDNCLIEAKKTLSGSYTIKENTRVIAVSAFSSCESITSVTIPNSITQISDYAFSRCTALQSIELPSSVTSINKHAFYECKSLTTLSLPTNLKNIGEGAFCRCYAITSPINIPNGVTCIADSAFVQLFESPSITIPNTVESIGKHAFHNCTKLSSISIPRSVITIGEGAFKACYLNSIVVESGNPNYDSRDNCNAIIETSTNCLIQGGYNTTIPKTITRINDYAFYFSSPKSILIPKSVAQIDTFAFHQCHHLENIVVESGNPNYDSRDNCNAIIETATNTLLNGCCNTIIPNTVDSIGDNSFNYCKRLKSITIPEGVLNIGYGAFSYCDSLASVTMGNSIKHVGDYAFNCCFSLQSIVIPDSVIEIGFGTFNFCRALARMSIGSGIKKLVSPFSGCYNLTTVICKAVEVPEIMESYSFTYANATLYVPAESIDLYKSDYIWSQFGTILPLEDAPSSVEDIHSPSSMTNCQKIMRNGQIIILQDDKAYNVVGQIVE